MRIKLIPRKLIGTVDAMPSKSHAHRLLIAKKLAAMQGNALGSLQEGGSGSEPAGGLDIPAFSDDIEATMTCLSQMDKISPYMECRESGSTLRFLLPVVMALKDNATFLGTGRLPDRPISPLKEEMEIHGCRFRMGSSKNTDRFKEICSVSGRLQPGEFYLPGNISSQFITGLLFALPLLDRDSWIILTTELESAGYVEMTLGVLRQFGIDIAVESSEEGFPVYGIPGRQQYVEPAGLLLDGDWSNAALWLAAGAISGDVSVRGLNLDSYQWDKEILDILAQMRADVDISPQPDGTSIISSKACNLQGVDIDVSQIPDLAPILAVLMAFAEGTSMISHGERLKLKESNRVKSIYAMLYDLGADISYGGDRLSFTGKAFLNGGEVDSHNDHRIIMAAGIASCLCSGPVYIQNPIAVAKSYPNFFNDFTALGGEIEYE